MNIQQLPNEIEGDNVILKRHTVELAEDMFGHVDADRRRLRTFLPWVDKISCVEDEIDYIEECDRNWNKCTNFDFGVFVKESDQYVGNIGVHAISFVHDRAEIGYWILGEYEGRGYITDAVTALERTLFEIGFNRIQIKCDQMNDKSKNIPLRCGYKFEGVSREDVWVEDHYRNTETYSKLKRERDI